MNRQLEMVKWNCLSHASKNETEKWMLTRTDPCMWRRSLVCRQILSLRPDQLYACTARGKNHRGIVGRTFSGPHIPLRCVAIFVCHDISDLSSEVLKIGAQNCRESIWKYLKVSPFVAHKQSEDKTHKSPYLTDPQGLWDCISTWQSIDTSVLMSLLSFSLRNCHMRASCVTPWP